MDKFVSRMKLSSLEIAKVTEKTVVVQVGNKSTRLKKRLSEFGNGEYIELDLSTLNWLGLIDDDYNAIDNDCLRYATGFRNRFKSHELAYRLFANKFISEE